MGKAHRNEIIVAKLDDENSNSKVKNIICNHNTMPSSIYCSFFHAQRYAVNHCIVPVDGNNFFRTGVITPTHIRTQITRIVFPGLPQIITPLLLILITFT